MDENQVSRTGASRCAFALFLIALVCSIAIPHCPGQSDKSDPISSSVKPPYAPPAIISKKTKTLTHFLHDTYAGKMGFVQNSFRIQPLAEAGGVSAVNSVKLEGRDTATFVISHCKKQWPDTKRGFVAVRVIRFFPLKILDVQPQEIVNLFRNEKWVKTPDSEAVIPKFGPNLDLKLDSWTLFTTKHQAIEFDGVPWHAATGYRGKSSREYVGLWEQKIEPKDLEKYIQISARKYCLKYNAMLIGFAETTSHGSTKPPDFELENMNGCLAAIISVRHPWLERYYKDYFVTFEGKQ